MGQGSRIEWTEATWNPVTGCSKISPGCKHCYAERMARRLRGMGVARYRNGFRVTTHPDVLDLPAQWKKPRVVFVNSMSDLFHPSVPVRFVQQVFAVMDRASQHTFQVLTKRPEIVMKIADRLPWPDNVWFGTSVESALFSHRIATLRRVPAKVHFLSLEPLLGPMPRLSVRGVDWVIVGGESGPGARPMQPEWVRQIRDRCVANGVPFFFKQWGGLNKKRNGRVLDGRTWDESPRLRKRDDTQDVRVAAT